MRMPIYIVIVLFAVAGLVAVAKDDPGYVMINFQGWVVELNVVVAGLLALLAFTLFYFALRLLIATGFFPRSFSRWRHRHQDDVAHKVLAKGLIELNLGKWSEAERHLVKSARCSSLAPVALMAAARAAEGQGKTDRRDGYMHMARDSAKSKNALAFRLAEAQLQWETGHADQAAATLKALPSSDKNHPQALRLQTNALRALKDWPALVELLPRLQSNKVFPQDKFYGLEHEAYAGLINHVGRHKDSPTLWELWRKMPKRLHEQEDIVIDFGCNLIHAGCSNQVEEILYTSINHHWRESVVYVYGLLDGDAEIHLSRAKNWLKKHPDSPVLLLSLGRLALRAHQWQDAQGYLEASLKAVPNPEAYQELGNLLAFLNQSAQAIECYRRSQAMNNENGLAPRLGGGDDKVEHAHLPRPKLLLPEIIQEAEVVAKENISAV